MRRGILPLTLLDNSLIYSRKYYSSNSPSHLGSYPGPKPILILDLVRSSTKMV